MKDKRQVSTDALETLGTIIKDGGRDAIHLAVEPVVAAHDLVRGQHIGLDENGKASAVASKMVGIVDPFLHDVVKTGEMFWLIVYPRQITSLRHVWSHPDFEEKEVHPVLSHDPISESKRWIEGFAAQLDQTYNRLMSAADLWVSQEDYTYDNSETYKDHWDKFPEFWIHYKVVTGEEPSDKGSFFTCSC
jgi:hypothetical protein